MKGFDEQNLPGPFGSDRDIAELAADHFSHRHERVVISGYDGINIGIRPNSDAEEEIRLLGRAATQFRHIDDASAVQCLERAQAIARAIDSHQTLDWWTRLPKYLLSAKRHADALAACLDLIADVRPRVERHLSHNLAAAEDVIAFEAEELQSLLLKIQKQAPQTAL